MKTYKPKEAVARLDAICQELKNHNVDPQNIEVLQQLSQRFRTHFTRLESFHQRLVLWAEGSKC